VDRIVVALRDIAAALSVVREVARRTPTVPFVDPEGGDLRLKLENLQHLGAFKIRGTWNRLSQLSEGERRRGVTTLSSGNHGRAVAWGARRMGLRCVVRVPEGAAPQKVDAIRAEGAELISIPRPELIRVHEEELWRSWPETFLHPFAHPAMIAGNGTIGLEIAEDVPDVRTVLVPVGGGGLVAGIAIAVKATLPRAKVFGVQAEGAATLPVALRTGRAHHIERPATIADGIRVGIMLPNMVEVLRRHVDGCLLVTDDGIRAAIRRLAREAKVVAEPAGAAAFAAWDRFRAQLEPPVVAVVSGGNVDPGLLADVVA
jgi:threonine dehydratase